MKFNFDLYLNLVSHVSTSRKYTSEENPFPYISHNPIPTSLYSYQSTPSKQKLSSKAKPYFSFPPSPSKSFPNQFRPLIQKPQDYSGPSISKHYTLSFSIPTTKLHPNHLSLITKTYSPTIISCPSSHSLISLPHLYQKPPRNLYTSLPYPLILSRYPRFLLILTTNYVQS
jgi:hypothetical protein